MSEQKPHAGLRFGTDGVRARAYEALRPDWVARLGQAAGQVFDCETVVIGSDGRESGPDFVAALHRGFTAEGYTTWDAGVAPTPVIAHAAAAHDVVGAMVSASHNPWHDNGVKFFAPGGRKLTDAQQGAIEDLLDGTEICDPSPAAGPPASRPDLIAVWADHVVASLDGRSLDGLHVLLDCANGASSAVAGSIFGRVGAHVELINTAPTGKNINLESGSTHPERLQAAVTARGAAMGFAFDGDADRVLAVDAGGALIDGDHEIAMCALDLSERGLLADNTVVVTVMSNLGFRLSMDAHGVTMHETSVGDRHVLEALEANGWSLGGEQSGHVIFHDIATTGDGLLTAVQLADVVRRSGMSMADLAAASMTQLPQVLENVRVSGNAGDLVAPLQSAIAAVEADLGPTGRVLVRPSGTEPLLRIMVEAASAGVARAAVDRLKTATQALIASD